VSTCIEKTFKKLDDINGRSLSERIAEALKGLRYGSVEIVVHDSRIVQIERKERWRMDVANPAGDKAII
jgi:hypothetical protein